MTKKEFNELTFGDTIATFESWTNDSAKLIYAKVTSTKTKSQRSVSAFFLKSLKSTIVSKYQCKNWKLVKKGA